MQAVKLQFGALSRERVPDEGPLDTCMVGCRQHAKVTGHRGEGAWFKTTTLVIPQLSNLLATGRFQCQQTALQGAGAFCGTQHHHLTAMREDRPHDKAGGVVYLSWRVNLPAGSYVHEVDVEALRGRRGEREQVSGAADSQAKRRVGR